MYQAWHSCREISESREISLSTIRSWTVDVLRSPGTFFCALCGKKKRTLNIQQIYCSMKCKNRANYQRHNALGPRPCDRCGKKYQPKHGNARYCSVICRKRKTQDRLERAREVFKQLEANQTDNTATLKHHWNYPVLRKTRPAPHFQWLSDATWVHRSISVYWLSYRATVHLGKVLPQRYELGHMLGRDTSQ